jgi:hypothetical protein
MEAPVTAYSKFKQQMRNHMVYKHKDGKAEFTYETITPADANRHQRTFMQQRSTLAAVETKRGEVAEMPFGMRPTEGRKYLAKVLEGT